MKRWLAALVLAAGQACADPAIVEATLDAMEAVDAAGRLLEEAVEDEDRVAGLTRAVQAFEHGLAVLRDADRKLRIHHAAARSAFEDDSGDVSRILAAMQASGSPVTATRFLHPAGPLGSAQATLLMGDVLPGLQQRAQIVLVRLQEVEQLDATLNSAESALIEGAEAARSARLTLVEAIHAQNDLPDVQAALSQALQISGQTLEDLALALSEQSGSIAVGLDESAPLVGNLPLPVTGAILWRFGERNERPGIGIATEANALVTTPIGGTVRFVGTIAGYGNVIVIEPAPANLLVVTGVHEPLTVEGQVLLAGAPLGLMGETRASTGLQSDHGLMLTETLYVETRTNGDRVNPATWFALDEEP